MYIANHYVRVGQDLLKKGDLIPSDLPEDKIKWLLEAGAIQKATVPLKFYGHGELPVIPASEAAEAIPLIEAETEEDEEPIDSSDEEEDIDMEEEIPEVDVMSGIVSEEVEAPLEKAAPKATKKSNIKKQTGGKK